MKNAYLVRPDVPEDWVDATVTDSETSVCLLTPVGPHDMLEVRDGIYRQGKGEPYHQHDIGTEIFYLAQGRVEATIRGKTCTVNAGDMVFIPQGVPHGLRFPDRQTTWRVFLQGMNVYRRRIADMTALPEEIEGAMAEGCEVLPLKAPVAIQTDENGKVTGLVVQPQVIGEVRGGRPAPRDADQPQEVIPCDVVLMAVGQAVDSKDFAQAGVPVSRNNIVAADDGSVPGMEGVFSGGDCVSGPATVILAVAAGKVAAASIDEYLGCHTDISANLEIPPAPFRLKHATGRVDLTEREASWRKNDFELMENCMSEQEMAQECSRCLRCDHYGHAGFKGGRRETW